MQNRPFRSARLPTKYNNRQRVSVNSKLLCRPRNLCYYHIWTIMLKLDFINSLPLYHQVCNKYSDKSNWWSICLSLTVVSSTVGAISSSQSSTTLLILVNGVPWRIFSKSTVHNRAYKNGSREENHVLLGVIYHPFGKTWYSLPLYKIWQL